ncbi:MAG: hypothetical protein LUH53_03305, partial [Lachnospiraceae bacterium]|nr:hypothetical protein [Lachnospiraceae bacterium]
QYQWTIYNENLEEAKEPLKKLEPLFKQYKKIKVTLKEKYAEKRTLLAEKKGLGFFDLKGKQEVSGKLAIVVNEIDELKSEKLIILKRMGCPEEKEVPRKESTMKKMQSNRKKLENTCLGLLHQYEDERQKYKAVIHSVATEDWAEVTSQQGSQHYQERINLMSRVKADQGECFNRNVFDQAESTVSRDIRSLQLEYCDRHAPILQKISQKEQQQSVERNNLAQRQRRRQQER